jgi:hypothetical protein
MIIVTNKFVKNVLNVKVYVRVEANDRNELDLSHNFLQSNEMDLL